MSLKQWTQLTTGLPLTGSCEYIYPRSRLTVQKKKNVQILETLENEYLMCGPSTNTYFSTSYFKECGCWLFYILFNFTKCRISIS